MENEEIKREHNADKNQDVIEKADNAESVENDELAQDFLDMRRSIQRMNHRRDAWTRR